ncbi:probable cytochrome P450 301a1, mitochondrial [Ctenocephalides felis]|nr:probable cytochrome P450 301a1, mitochondrial [Ctenocephalides felis]
MSAPSMQCARYLHTAGRRGAHVASIAAPSAEQTFAHALPYSRVPGPRPLPLLGNTWRLLPIIGQYQISDIARVSEIFYEKYGRIVRLGGLLGRPDLLFVYDADEIEKVYRNEGPTPFRPSMPCLVHYKGVVRKDFFGDLPGVVGV